MSYLMIRNPGVADAAAFTLLGVSTTRDAGQSGTIGQYGSGSKNAVALFLRKNIPVTIYCGTNDKLEFFSKPMFVKGQRFDQVCVRNGAKAPKDLGFTLQWGVQDWTKLTMAFREFVANAIDGAIISGGTHKDIEIEVVDKPRAKAGYTAVFLPLVPEVQECWDVAGTLFLHLSNSHLLNKKLLPKLRDKGTLIYKNGVLVCKVDEDSVFDYNLGSELTLDESRNAQYWDVRWACAKAISNADAGDLVKVLNAQIEGKKVFESNLDSSALFNEYDSEDKKAERKGRFQAAFKVAAGDNSVLCSGKNPINEFVKGKGFKPVVIEGNWFQALEKNGVATQNEVLSGLERDGFNVCDPTPDMVVATEMVWDFLAEMNLLNGREKPVVKGFVSIMSGEGQVLGRYKDKTVYYHTDIGVMSPMLLKAALEEVAHHTTGATDMSRDLQDYLFRLIVQRWLQEIANGYDKRNATLADGAGI